MNPPRAYTEIDLGGGQIFVCPPLEAPKGGQNLNCKFKTFKATHAVQLPYKYYTLSDISLQTKLAEILNGITRQKNKGKR